MPMQSGTQREMASKETVGILGLGLLGSAVASRLDGEGYMVFGYDAQSTDTNSATAVGSCADLFDCCETILLCLPDSSVVRAILQEQSQNLVSGKHMIVDLTTGDPSEMVAVGAELAKRDVVYLEAKVAGSSDAAQKGEALYLVGGAVDAIERCRPLLEVLSERFVVTGEVGSASRMKLVHNLLLGLNRAVLAEALGFGESLGFDRQVVLEILKQSPAFSQVMLTKGERLAKGEFDSPQARLSQHLKDVRLILDNSEQTGAETPFSLLHRDLLEALEEAGYGASDNSAIAAAFRKP